jgi:hypothetical protein
MGIDTPVECGVWLKTTAQVWPNVPVCYDEFAMHHIAVFWVIYSELHCRDILIPLNKNAGFQFGLVEHTDCAQYMFDLKN